MIVLIVFEERKSWVFVHQFLQLVSFSKQPLTRGGRSAIFINVFCQPIVSIERNGLLILMVNFA